MNLFVKKRNCRESYHYRHDKDSQQQRVVKGKHHAYTHQQKHLGQKIRYPAVNKILQHYTKTVSWQFDAKILDMLYILKLTVTEWSGKEH
jgi:hypothetical protein